MHPSPHDCAHHIAKPYKQIDHNSFKLFGTDLSRKIMLRSLAGKPPHKETNTEANECLGQVSHQVPLLLGYWSTSASPTTTILRPFTENAASSSSTHRLTRGSRCLTTITVVVASAIGRACAADRSFPILLRSPHLRQPRPARWSTRSRRQLGGRSRIADCGVTRSHRQPLERLP